MSSSSRTARVSILNLFRKDIVWREVLLSNRPILWVIGASHSGKTALAHFLTDATNYYLVAPQGLLTDQRSNISISSPGDKYELIKKEIKRTFKFCRGYIFDDVPSTMTECRKFERKLCKPTVVIYIQISLDAALGRILSLSPTIDLNAARVSYVRQSKFAEKVARRYEKRHKLIKVFSQYPMQETHAKILEILETEFSYKFHKSHGKPSG